MKKPYFKSVRIAMEESTKAEFEMPTLILFCHISRIEQPDPADDIFKNRAPKAVVFLDSGSVLWLLMDYAALEALFIDWLDDASNIQSVFTRN